MYADYVAYNANKAVVWGGHSGDLRKFEEFYPVLRKPLPYFFERYAVDYLVLDLAYTSPERLGLDDRTEPLAHFGPIGVYLASAPQRGQEAERQPVAPGQR
jgi:hypothetical protein